jgi:hypothetical protein
LSDVARRLALLPAVLLGLALVVVACGDQTKPSTAVAGPTPTPTAQPVIPIGSGPLVIDPRLLHTLPDEVAGVPLASADATALGLISDPALARSALGIAVGIFAAPGNSVDEDLAIATVVGLRPGVNDDTFYKGWRADYDLSACEAAGGVASHAQQVIGGRPVEVTTCREGVELYHTRLDGDRLVSITAAGDRKLGGLIMAGLRE